LLPIARIATGGGPIQRIPAAPTASAKAAFSARKPKPGWTASAWAARAAATTAAMSRRSTASGPSVGGATATIPTSTQVRVILAAISPRLAMKIRAMAERAAGCTKRPAAAVTKASNASDATRQRPPTRRAGRRPCSIQRWTERVVAPIRAAA